MLLLQGVIEATGEEGVRWGSEAGCKGGGEWVRQGVKEGNEWGRECEEGEWVSEWVSEENFVAKFIKL